MLFIFSKILRFLIKTIKCFVNLFRIIKIKFIYPKTQISTSSSISHNCDIRCSDNSSLIISNSFIGNGSKIIADHGGQLEIKDSFIGSNCVIVARSSISIESHCQIAEMVVIRDQNHNYGQKNKTISDQGFNTSPIVIEKNVWLGAKTTVTAGSQIRENTVVGAHALVRGSLDANSVYVGTPVRKVKTF